MTSRCSATTATTRPDTDPLRRRSATPPDEGTDVTTARKLPGGADGDRRVADVRGRGHIDLIERHREPRRGSRADRPTKRPGRPPDPAQLATLLVRLTGEVAAGRRPIGQLEPLLAPTLLHRLATQLLPGVERPRDLPRIRRVLAAPPTPTGAVEVTVLVEDDDRVTALAIRLERHHGLWRATELTAPESGYAPLPTRSDPLRTRGPDAFDEAELEEATAAAFTRRRGSA